jgi:hypothetical protein
MPLTVIEVPAGDDLGARLASSPGPPDEVVLLVPDGGYRLLAEPGEIVGVLHGTGVEAIAARSGRAWLGARAALAAGDVVDDVSGALLHEVGRGDTSVVVLDGRVRNGITHTDPVVVVGAPDALRWLDALRADGGSRDLSAILGYRGAVDATPGARLVGADMLALPFWTPSFCAAVIRAAEAVGAFGPQDDDPVPGNEVSLGAISPRLFAHLEDDLLVRAMPAIHEHWPYVDYHGLRDAFVITYAPGGQEALRMHHDTAQLSGSIKLNDGYDGGELAFPRQGVDNAALPVGTLLLWPSLVTHPHEARPIRAGVKYNLTIWFEIPDTPRAT